MEANSNGVVFLKGEQHLAFKFDAKIVVTFFDGFISECSS